MSFLQNKNVQYYFIADIISNFASGMCFVGLNWFLLQKTGLSEKVGLLMSINIIGSLIILPFAGSITDHYSRKVIIVYSNYARALSLLLVVILLLTTKFNLYYLYFLAASNGICRNLYLPASRAFIQEIADRRDFLKANSFLEISLQIGMFIAGAMAGITYKLFSIQVLLIAIMLIFVVSNVFLHLIKYKKTFVATLNETFINKTINGCKYLFERPIILIFGIILFLPFVATITLNVVTPAYVSNFLKSDSVVFGVVDMCYGIGAFLAGFVVMYLSSKYKKNVTIQRPF